MNLAPRSLRSRLLIGLLVPLLLGIVANTVSLYRQALRAADTAYDRTLLASAKSIGEQLQVTGAGDAARVQATVPYSALEAFEADNRSRMYFKVSGFQGEMVSGFEDLPAWRGRLPDRGPYAALVDFYDDTYRDQPVRVAVLLQPVASPEGRGMATIQVAETLELRQTLARQILVDTLWRQAALLVVLVGAVLWVVQRATRPVRELSAQLRDRAESDLSPLAAPDAPRELQPLLDALNQVMSRLAHLLEHQKRFVRDSAHQLRTPLAVLKSQTELALNEATDPALRARLQRVHESATRSAHLVNQLLTLARAEPESAAAQGRARVELLKLAGEVAAEWVPKARQAGIDLGFEDGDGSPVVVSGNALLLREAIANLIDNAIRYAGRGATVTVRVRALGPDAQIEVEDNGPGIAPADRERVFERFARATMQGDGCGLGLPIVREIAQRHGGQVSLEGAAPKGLRVLLRLPRLPT